MSKQALSKRGWSILPAVSVSLVAFLTIVACALLWAGFDLSRKSLVAKVEPVPLLVVLTLGQAPLFAAWAAAEGWPGFAPGYWPPALATLALNVVANLAFFYAFKVAPLSQTIPLLSLTPAFTALSAIPLLGEWPTARQGAGIALVVAGALLLHLPSGGERTWRSFFAGLLRQRGAQLMLVVALCWSLTPPFDKLALSRASGPAHGFVLCTGVALVLALVLAARGRLAELGNVRQVPFTFAVALVISTAALGVQFAAYELTGVALVETVKRGVGNVAALAVGRWVFGEVVGGVQVVAVAVMVGGVGLILF